MKVGIVGLPQTGKKTLFRVLTGSGAADQGGQSKPLPGTADIVDERFDKLVEMYEPKKETRARIDLVLLPKIEQETIAKGDIFQHIVDQFIQVFAANVLQVDNFNLRCGFGTESFDFLNDA